MLIKSHLYLNYEILLNTNQGYFSIDQLKISINTIPESNLTAVVEN